MRRNQSIDLLKLIAAFFVVIIHNRFPGDFGFAANAIARFAVPTFFMITGYFTIQPDNSAIKIKQQIIKLAKYFLAYELIYILYEFALAVHRHDLLNFKNRFAVDMKLILIAPPYGYQLWYMVNIVWVLVIVYIFNYFNKLKVLFASSVILHLAGIFGSHLSVQLFHKVLDTHMTRNFLFFGLFYVMVGGYLRKVDLNKIKISNNIILLFSIFMGLSQVIERHLWTVLFDSHFADYFITTIFASIGIFVYALRSNINNKIVERISNYSMPIYFLHILVMNIIVLLSVHYGIKISTSTILGNLKFIIMVCIFSCILYDVCSKLLQLVISKVIKPL